MSIRTSHLRAAALFLVGTVALALATALPALAAPSSCTEVRLPVRLAAEQPEDQVIAGTLCPPLTPGSPSGVDVLTAGATYTSRYWDWPAHGSLSSFVDHTREAGRATFAYDRIGTGASSHPPSTSITVKGEAHVLHQIMQWLRSEHGYQQVNLIGHSYGSVVSVEAAGAYPEDVDRLVVTGLAHVPNVGAGLPAVFASLLNPAPLDPAFRDAGLDPGYVTTIPGTRGEVFYSATADSTVIADDEAHKDVISLTAVASGVDSFVLPPLLNASNRVEAPVLLVLGGRDSVFCALPEALACGGDAALRTLEAPYYTSASSFHAVAVPGTGHNLPLHPSADDSFEAINAWIDG